MIQSDSDAQYVEAVAPACLPLVINY